VGPVRLIDTESSAAPRKDIPASAVREEIARLERSRSAVRSELDGLRERVEGTLGPTYTAILDAQTSILDDPSLIDEVVRWVRSERVGVRWALAQVVEDHAHRLRSVKDPYLRERSGDLHDIHRRLQRHLRGDMTAPELPATPGIVVAHHLGPADTAMLAEQGALGLATDVGGRTSHTAIMAQALGVPAVAGLRDLTLKVRAGDLLVLDGFSGHLLVDPTLEEHEAAVERASAWEAEQRQTDLARSAAGARTFDDVEIVLRANIELPGEAATLQRFGAHGVGLYRSEFLFLSCAPHLPTEQEHLATYRAIAEAAAPDPVVVRTFDLGGEKYFHEVLALEEPNPVLGLRGVRLCLTRPDIFRPQLRALLRVAAEYPVRLMLPLVSDVDEIHHVRRMLAEEADRLAARGIAHDPEIAVGIMIEVPAAAAAADFLAHEADFIALGTNDLIQYALAVDRGNESVQRFYQPLHRGVLRLLRFVVEAAAAAEIPVSVCGEMAADPALTEWLVGLGVREFSMQPRSLATIRGRLATIDSNQAKKHVSSTLAIAHGRSKRAGEKRTHP
jgi:phosphotransferase system enzyme I (PtsI)